MKRYNRDVNARGRNKCIQKRLARLKRIYKEIEQDKNRRSRGVYAYGTPAGASASGLRVRKDPPRRTLAASTYEELQDAVKKANSNDTIQVTGDISMTGGLTIPVNKAITIQSDPLDRHMLTRSPSLGGDMITLLDNSQLFLKDILVRGGGEEGGAPDAGSIIAVTNNNARAYLYGGAVLEDNVNKTSSGGAVRVDGDGLAELCVDGGAIINNAVEGNGQYGGGVFVVKGVLELRNGSISGNTAEHGGGAASLSSGFILMPTDSAIAINHNKALDGGGVYLNGAAFAMSNGAISENDAQRYGGGLYMTGNAAFNMSGGSIDHNDAVNGGGIADESLLGAMSVNGEITSNKAKRMGGGIYIEHDSLSRLNVGDSAVFADNHAEWSTAVHAAADNLLYNSFVSPLAEWSAHLTQGYNNYDISYRKESSGGGGGTPSVFRYARTNNCRNQIIWCAATNYCECANGRS